MDMTAEERQKWLEYLMDLDIPASLSPEQKLMLAVLRQSVLDYFGDDPWLQIDAALYFAESPVYQWALQLFDLPADLIPEGVDLSAYRKEVKMNEKSELDPVRLETLVGDLSPMQLKIVLTMGLLDLPVPTRKISMKCGVSRSTALTALDQMVEKGMVLKQRIDGHAVWSFADAVRPVIDRVWQS